MIETLTSTLYGKELIIGAKFAQGGQGIVWEVDDPALLVKQFEPELIADDPGAFPALRRTAERAYKAFCAVNKGTQAELASLPREYVPFRDNPAYLMQKAEGELLQTLLRQKNIAPDNRLPLAHAIARAIRKLHAAQKVHADINPENLIIQHTTTGFTVRVIDIDGGGLLSPPGPVYPMSQPKRLYKSPELAATQWKHLYEKSLAFAPDQWALAVLLYQLLVDYQGPFCRVQTHPDPAVTNCSPYAPDAYRDPAVAWPQPWQETVLKNATLSNRVITLFYQTFQHRFTLERRPRPTAAQWEAALSDAAAPPVRYVYTLPVATLPGKSALPALPEPVNTAAATQPALAPVAQGSVLPLGARVKKNSGRVSSRHAASSAGAKRLSSLSGHSPESAPRRPLQPPRAERPHP